MLRSDDENDEPKWDIPASAAKRLSQRLRRALELFPEMKVFGKRVSLLGNGVIGFSDGISIIQAYPNLRRLDLASVTNEELVRDHNLQRDAKVERESVEKALPPHVSHDELNKLTPMTEMHRVKKVPQVSKSFT
jgi:hypothetical protein